MPVVATSRRLCDSAMILMFRVIDAVYDVVAAKSVKDIYAISGVSREDERWRGEEEDSDAPCCAISSPPTATPF